MSSLGRRLPSARPRPPALPPLEEEELGSHSPRGPTGGHGGDGVVQDEGRPCPHPAAHPYRTVSSIPYCLSSSELCPLRPFRHFGLAALTNSPVLLHGEGWPSHGRCPAGCGTPGRGTPVLRGLDATVVGTGGLVALREALHISTSAG
jgi:hypothetical protein